MLDEHDCIRAIWSRIARDTRKAIYVDIQSRDLQIKMSALTLTMSILLEKVKPAEQMLKRWNGWDKGSIRGSITRIERLLCLEINPFADELD